MNEFVSCALCASNPETLCHACVTNRTTIERLEKEMQDLTKRLDDSVYWPEYRRTQKYGVSPVAPKKSAVKKPRRKKLIATLSVAEQLAQMKTDRIVVHGSSLGINSHEEGAR